MLLSRQNAASIAIFTGIAFAIYVAFFGVRTIGRDVLVIAIARIASLPALRKYGESAGVVSGGSRMGTIGWWLAVVTALLYLLAALAWIISDGWLFDPFATDIPVRPEYASWYAYVVGVSLIGFTMSTILIGVAGWRRQGAWPAVLVILAGLLFFAISASPVIGGFVYIAPWIALGVWLLFNHAPSASVDTGMKRPVTGA